MRRIDNYERSIIHYLAHAGPANTNKISKKLSMSWATADTKLKALSRKGYVKKDQVRSVWVLRY